MARSSDEKTNELLKSSTDSGFITQGVLNNKDQFSMTGFRIFFYRYVNIVFIKVTNYNLEFCFFLKEGIGYHLVHV